ncbi:MAG: bifunctional metallophosphatase/5'-nucleotidase [Hyphomonadaceae bacterium]
MRYTPVAIASLLALAACATTPAAVTSSAPIQVNLLAINDFHGNLDPPGGGVFVIDRANPGARASVPGGGAPRLASAVAELARRPNTVMVAAGDLIGASPLLSSLFHDEPTIEALSAMGLAITSVGNHEFDEGWQELKRMQTGGCHPVDGCKGPRPFAGATFEYLAASTFLDDGTTLFPPYSIREFDGVKVGFIGMTLEGTPDVITPAARAGIRFADEAETVNALVPELQAQGVEAIVVLLHEGGFTTGAQDDCRGLAGTIVDIVPKFDKAVDVVVTGHTNGIYICTVDGRLVTSAGAYGTRLTDISMLIDPKTGDVIGARARDVMITADAYAEDPAQVALINAYRTQAEPLMKRIVGATTAVIARGRTATGETVLGDIIADSMLAAARRAEPGTQIAFMNPGGIRADLPFNPGGQLTFADIFAVQPFGNDLVVLTLTGSDIETILRQQYQPGGNNILQVSDGFAFTWRQAAGQPIEIIPGSVRLNGAPLVPTQTYRVVTNNFLAGGGDSFAGFRSGKDKVTVGSDLEALETYVTTNSPLAASSKGRISRAD